MVLKSLSPVLVFALTLSSAFVARSSANDLHLSLGAGFPTNGGGSKTLRPVAEISTSIAGPFSLQGRASVQRHVIRGVLDSRYVTSGVGLQTRVPLVSHPSLISDGQPGLVFSRWRRLGLNKRQTKMGASFGAGLQGDISKSLCVSGIVHRYVSEGSRIYYTDVPNLDLPGVAETRLELHLDWVIR